jgi:sec-independent protein translocase protein TatA
MEPMGFVPAIAGIGFQELVLILIVVVVLFGGKKIPEVAKGLGEGIRNFKTAMKGEEETAEKKDPPKMVKSDEQTAEKKDTQKVEAKM